MVVIAAVCSIKVAILALVKRGLEHRMCLCLLTLGGDPSLENSIGLSCSGRVGAGEDWYKVIVHILADSVRWRTTCLYIYD
jgi:hypothetical protein